MTWDLIGHQWAVHLLKEHIRRDGVRHAYLLTGPAGVGKRTLALQFARALECANPPEPGEYCGNCRPCRLILEQQFTDVSVLSAETVGGDLKVDVVRELQHSLSLTPYESPRRVAILLRFHEANENAQNALLKTLEEAPGKSVLILTADMPENLLPTITSRCELLRLRPLAVDALAENLTAKFAIPPTEALLLARISGGRPGLARQLQLDENLNESRKVWVDRLFALMTESLAQKFSTMEKEVKLRNSTKEERDVLRMQLREGLTFWQSIWRDVMLQSTGLGLDIANVDYRDRIEELAAIVDENEAARQIQKLEDASNRLGSANIQLLFEVLVMGLPEINPLQNTPEP